MADAINTPEMMKSTTITQTINSRMSFIPRPITSPKHTENSVPHFVYPGWSDSIGLQLAVNPNWIGLAIWPQIQNRTLWSNWAGVFIRQKVQTCGEGQNDRYKNQKSGIIASILILRLFPVREISINLLRIHEQVNCLPTGELKVHLVLAEDSPDVLENE